MSTNLKALGVATTMLTGFVLGGSVTAYAEEPESKPGVRSYDSNAMIQFEPASDITPPTNPTDPGEKDKDTGEIVKPGPILPDGEEPKEGTPGPLSIDFASSLNFGKQKITSTDQIYKAAKQKFRNRTPEFGPNYVQVTDGRGSDAGWSLQVKQNKQFESTKGKELIGAEIRFTEGQVNTGSASPKPSIVKRSFALKFNEYGEGVADTIMSAKAEEGSGTYVLAFGADDNAAETIELFVPGSTTKYADKYSTSITWTLTDVPGIAE
ncbi:cell surface protein [Lysinibacillus xylanilyticus]|uniref:Cell surface protein n=1 Tax=Lysinibacillus xylanilyticus TaxID=582475 RepID=A0A2M9PY86_9BACI|nr:cell surface protein [Lysinibacillus xylanilyticus]